MLPGDASAEAEQAYTPWDIKSKEQLCQWAIDQLDEIIKMLDELRGQRDMALECIEQ